MYCVVQMGLICLYSILTAFDSSLVVISMVLMGTFFQNHHRDDHLHCPDLRHVFLPILFSPQTYFVSRLNIFSVEFPHKFLRGLPEVVTVVEDGRVVLEVQVEDAEVSPVH
jgi:hypothetical protein